MLATLKTNLNQSTTDDYSSYITTLTKRDVLCVVAASTSDARYDSYQLATFRVTSPCTSMTDSQMAQIELERETYLSKWSRLELDSGASWNVVFFQKKKIPAHFNVVKALCLVHHAVNTLALTSVVLEKMILFYVKWVLKLCRTQKTSDVVLTMYDIVWCVCVCMCCFFSMSFKL